MHAPYAGWPESPDSPYLWREGGEPARQAYANVAKAISEFEPLFMIANPGEPADNARKVLPGVASAVCGMGTLPGPWQGTQGRHKHIILLLHWFLRRCSQTRPTCMWWSAPSMTAGRAT